ncbi:mannosyltransferase [Microsporum ferrugineum]
MAVSEATASPRKRNLDKYFDEPGMDDTLRHYDSRFFKGVVPPADRIEGLTDMIRAYLQFFQENGLETWIAHGTLLGWWWNGKMLPWDWDVDTQVSSETLEYLGDYLNQTVYNYTGTIPSHGNKRQYLLDVNPASRERGRGDGQNIIDARWTDISSGIFTDITGISELNRDTEPGVLGDKNFHRYREVDIYPLRKSTCEGVPASVPFNYIDILVTEYGNSSLRRTEYENHFWSTSLQEWVPVSP